MWSEKALTKAVSDLDTHALTLERLCLLHPVRAIVLEEASSLLYSGAPSAATAVANTALPRHVIQAALQRSFEDLTAALVPQVAPYDEQLGQFLAVASNFSEAATLPLDGINDVTLPTFRHTDESSYRSGEKTLEAPLKLEYMFYNQPRIHQLEGLVLPKYARGFYANGLSCYVCLASDESKMRILDCDVRFTDNYLKTRIGVADQTTNVPPARLWKRLGLALSRSRPTEKAPQIAKVHWTPGYDDKIYSEPTASLFARIALTEQDPVREVLLQAVERLPEALAQAYNK